MYWERNNRHNFFDSRLENLAKKNGWEATTEPRIRDRAGKLLKPDLLLTKGQDVTVTDVTFSLEGSEPPNMAYAVKKNAIYFSPTFLKELEQMYPNKNIEIMPLIVGAREGW